MNEFDSIGNWGCTYQVTGIVDQAGSRFKLPDCCVVAEALVKEPTGCSATGKYVVCVAQVMISRNTL